MMGYLFLHLDIEHIRYFLGIVYMLSESNNLDRNSVLDLKLEDNLFQKILNIENNDKQLLFSVFIRFLLGGMKCDLKMLKIFIQKWMLIKDYYKYLVNYIKYKYY
jgi:hypothetical protein